jgi:hypothetical protein
LQGEEEWLLFLPVCHTLSDLKPKAQKGIKSQTKAKVTVWEESSASDNALLPSSSWIFGYSLKEKAEYPMVIQAWIKKWSRE